MKIINKFVLVLIALGSMCFTTCHNGIMETWWEDGGAEIVYSGTIAPPVIGKFYTVQFNANDGDPAPEPQQIADGAKIAKVSPMENGVKGFAGWYTEPTYQYRWNFTTYPINAEDTKNDVLTLYAKWDPATYKVEFNDNGADIRRDYNGNQINIRDQIVAQGGLVIEPAAGTKIDHGFAGWYNDADKDDVLDVDEVKWDFESPVSGDVNLIAKWGPKSCVVMFNANGAFPVPDSQFLTAGQYVREPEAITRVGYGFGGWFIDSSFSGASWDFRTTINSDMILHAKWVTNEYTVTFQADGGTPAPPNQKVPYGRQADRPPVMSREGKSLEGWYKDSTLSAAWDFIADTVTQNITLYAKWVDANYTVTFNGEGGSPSMTQQRVGFGGKVLRPADPVRTEVLTRPDGSRMPEFSFKGWYTKPDGDTTGILYNFDTTVVADMPLYARWVRNNEFMIWVPGGSYTMGGLGGSGATTRPAHKVTLSGFYMLIAEMNQATFHQIQWYYKQGNLDPYNFTNNTVGDGIFAYNPSQTESESHPVEQVTWYDAVEFCNMLTWFSNDEYGTEFEYAYSINSSSLDGSTKYVRGGGTTNQPLMTATVSLNPKAVPDGSYEPDKVGYRLPTEAEWEYAARGGHGTPGDFVWAGSNTANDVAWYGGGGGNAENVIHNGGNKAPNSLGLYDMSGNVGEWCWDKYDKASYGTASVTDPLGPSAGAGPATQAEERSRRGGSIRHTADNCRSQVRDFDNADNVNWNIGFRVVRSGVEP